MVLIILGIHTHKIHILYKYIYTQTAAASNAILLP